MNTAVRIAAVVAGLFVLLELTARVYLFGIAGLVPAKMNSVHGLNQTGFTRQSGDARIGFELKPDLDGYFNLATFRTNSKGLRDREYALEKPSDTFRVAVMGSSFTLPAGVEIERAFHSRWKSSYRPNSRRAATNSSTLRSACTAPSRFSRCSNYERCPTIRISS